MASQLGVSLPLSAVRETQIVQRARKYAQANGLLLRSDLSDHTVCRHIGVTLLPTPVPANTFRELCLLQPDYTQLYHQVAHDFNFLEQHLKPLAGMDEFLGRLWDIHEQVKDRPKEQHRCLLLGRNDFMLDESGQPKHIEFNTISSASAGWANRLPAYHRTSLRAMGLGDCTGRIADSKSDKNFAKAIIQAMETYPKGVILFVLEEENVNVYDQIHLEQAIYRQNSELRIIHKTLKQIDETGHLKDGKLFVDAHEVGLVYFRTAYAPQLFLGEMGWRVRLMLEKSRAILCPCIHTHLAGCKKIQQVLCNPGMVEKYINDSAVARKIRETFAHQYPTDQSPEGHLAVQLAVDYPDKYILKPQREGGGSKFFGQDIVIELDRLENSSERGKFVLMERVHPPQNPNYLLFDDGRSQYGDTVSEIGLYVSSMWNGGASRDTQFCGHFLKTKMADQDEGGIGMGISGIDSLLLV